MSVDNFGLISPLLRFDDPTDDFYVVQIIDRQQDKLLDTFYCYSADLERYRDRIVDRCMLSGARAYISLNKRSAYKVALRCVGQISIYLQNGSHKSVANAYKVACGTADVTSEERRWVVDVDTKDIMEVAVIETEIISRGGIVECAIPTVKGYHLITGKFDRRAWDRGVDIQPNCDTILFVP